MAKITKAYAKEQVRKFGLTFRERDGECRVNYQGGNESTAYYTDDRQDAIDTARFMMRNAAGVEQMTENGNDNWEAQQ